MTTNDSNTGADGHPLVSKLYDPVMALPERMVLDRHRRALAQGLSGQVLEIGAGTGAMFPYYTSTGADIEVKAIEPDYHMRQQANERADGLDLDITILDANAESLPFDDNSIDAAVVSLVFCTIEDPEAALAELARVLTSGGDVRFLEHVRARGAIGRAHDLLTPGWYHVAGGCHLNRTTGDLFRQDDRFELMEYTRFESGLTRALPLVRGRLKRRQDSRNFSVF